jgi:putrescine aminotransferase
MSTSFWHGFADMHLVKDAEIVMRSGDGVWLESTDGRRFIDATAALWYCAVGYGRQAIADAVAQQLVRLSAYSSFGAYTTEPTVLLAERLAAMSPMPETRVFFGSGGSDGVDTAAKLARRYWDVQGQPQRRVIVSREHGYHGMHAWGTALAGMPVNKAGYGGDIIEEVVHVGWSDTESLGALFEQRGHEIAAFIGEPVIGAGGVYPPEPSYWPEVQRLCRAHDVLLIADEVITGFGRTGQLWGSQRYGIEPDMVRPSLRATSRSAASSSAGASPPRSGMARRPDRCSSTATPTRVTQRRVRPRWRTWTSSRARVWWPAWRAWSAASMGPCAGCRVPRSSARYARSA